MEEHRSKNDLLPGSGTFVEYSRLGLSHHDDVIYLPVMYYATNETIITKFQGLFRRTKQEYKAIF